MRNLKRVLSLALATVMLLGMMVIGAGAADAKKKTAADLTDMDKVTNKAAVSLLVDLKVIEGKPDGSYAPAEIVDRATMAKLVTYIMMGDVDPNGFNGTTTPLTDIKGNWAEGYIKYCYANGIIAGDDKGNFNPSKPVTTVEAAKMMLVALGYDSKDRGYEGDASWSVNIMKDAQKMNLLTKLSVSATEGLSRDNAAQIIYNTLLAQTVNCEYSRDINGNKYVSKVTVTTAATDTLGHDTYGLTAKTGVLTATSTAALNGTVAAKGSVRVDANTVKVNGNVDLLGQQVVYYTKADGTTLISSSVVATGKSVIVSDTGTAFAKFIKDNSLNVTGAQYSDYATLAGAHADPTAGDLVKYIDVTNDGIIDYIVLTSYKMGKVTKTTAASGTTKATITVQGAGTYNSDEVEGLSDAAKDQMVIYAQIGSTLLLAKPETISGTISAYKGADGAVTSITVDGTAYKVSTITVNGSLTNGSVIGTTTPASKLLKSAGTFYKDKAGNVAYMVTTTEGAASYAYVLSSKKTASAFGTAGDPVYQAYVIMPDGTKATYELTSGSRFGKLNDTANLALPGYDADGAVNYATPTHNPAGATNLFKYTINSDGKMTLKAPVPANVDFDGNTNKDVKIEKNKAQFFVNTDGATTTWNAVASAYMNKDTIFMFYDAVGKDKTVTMFTGFENIPATTQVVAEAASYVKNATTNVVEIVYIQTAAVTNTDKVFAYGTGADAVVTSDGTQYQFVVNGELQTLLFDTAPVAYDIDKMYTIVTNNKGVSTATAVTTGTGADQAVLNAKVKAVADNYVILTLTDASEVVVYLADGYTVDNVTSTKGGDITAPSVGSLAVGDTICFVYGNGTNAAKLIKAYVVPTPELESVSFTQSGNVLTAVLRGARNSDATKTTYKWTVSDSATISAPVSGTATVGANTATVTAAGKVALEVVYITRTGASVTVSCPAAAVTYTAP